MGDSVGKREREPCVGLFFYTLAGEKQRVMSNLLFGQDSIVFSGHKWG